MCLFDKWLTLLSSTLDIVNCQVYRLSFVVQRLFLAPIVTNLLFYVRIRLDLTEYAYKLHVSSWFHLLGRYTVARKYNKVMQAVANVCEIAHLIHKAETWSLMDGMNIELQIVSNH